MDTVTQTANCVECGKLIKREAGIIYCVECFAAYLKTERVISQSLKNLSTFFDDLPPAS